jgi:hypothetical protein
MAPGTASREAPVAEATDLGATPGAPAAEVAAFQVLDAIEGATGGTMTVNGVADALGVDQPRASRLVEAGLSVREPA